MLVSISRAMSFFSTLFEDRRAITSQLLELFWSTCTTLDARVFCVKLQCNSLKCALMFIVSERGRRVLSVLSVTLAYMLFPPLNPGYVT